MYKRYHEKYNILLKEQSTIAFREVSSGVYYVEKDRIGIFSLYVDSKEVINVLNDIHKVSVFGINETYSNFELEN